MKNNKKFNLNYLIDLCVNKMQTENEEEQRVMEGSQEIKNRLQELHRNFLKNNISNTT